MEQAPLILTLTLDGPAQEFFDTLRTAHFPPERNYLRAHCTLFHALPTGAAEIRSHIAEVANVEAAFSVAVLPPKSLGLGIAYPLESSTLLRIHARLQIQWKGLLTAQDAKRLWPHITVQNKVDAVVAKRLQTQLIQSYFPEKITATGLSLWTYKGGPWAWMEDFAFGGQEVPGS